MAIVIGDVGGLRLDSKVVCDFYYKYWNRKIALSDQSFYEWQFRGSPESRDHDNCMVAVDDSTGNLVGVMGLNVRPFYLCNKITRGAELTTWVVDSEHVGSGVGAKILLKIQERFDALIGMGISTLALPVYMRSGFRFVRAIPRFVKVFDFDAIKPYATHSPLAKKLCREWLGLGRNVSFEVDAASLSAIEDIQKGLYEAFNCYSRSAAFLDWRYSRHPVFTYEQFFVRSGSTSAGKGVYVCLRRETSVAGLKILHVMDCFGTQEDMPAAMAFIHEYSVRHDIHLADFYCTAGDVARHYLATGWFSTNDDEFFQFPHLFHPIEMRTPPTTSLIYWSRNDFSQMTNVPKLYITKQDADLDRPVPDDAERADHVDE